MYNIDMGNFLNWYFNAKDDKKKYEDYKNWAFPYGEKQKDVVNKLVNELVPEEDQVFARYYYLVARQELIPNDYNNDYRISEEYMKQAYKKLKKSFTKVSKKMIHKYIALVEADCFIDENLKYPTIEQLNSRAEEILRIIK